jgi:hypothetical protein
MHRRSQTLNRWSRKYDISNGGKTDDEYARWPMRHVAKLSKQ